MREHEFDLIVLGSGPAGSTVATKAAADGKRVAMAEALEFGGTCALRGCNPKKVYTNAAAVVDQVRRSDGQLVQDRSGVRIDWPQLLRFKREFTQPVIATKKSSLQEKGITTFPGAAKFASPHEISVGPQTLAARRILIATGATPVVLGIPGEELITHSDDFLELESIPDAAVFVGGGYISMEFAHVVARCGKQVWVVQRGKQVLAGFDPDLVKQLVAYSEQIGIEFRTQVEVTSVAAAGEALRVGLSDGDSLDCALVVHGAGRVPNIANLNLDVGQVDHDKQGILVDSSMRSRSNSSVFAAGDCAASGMPRLTPCANEEARIIAQNLFSDQNEHRPDYGIVPKVAFTTPAIASVGLSESAAKEQANVDVRYDDTSTWGSVRKTGESVAGYKLLVDQETDKILGAHLLGPAAEETINLFALAMKFGLTAMDMKSTLFAFPTFASDVRRMLAEN